MKLSVNAVLQAKSRILKRLREEAGELLEWALSHPDHEVIKELGRGGMGVVYLELLSKAWCTAIFWAT